MSKVKDNSEWKEKLRQNVAQVSEDLAEVFTAEEPDITEFECALTDLTDAKLSEVMEIFKNLHLIIPELQKKGSLGKMSLA